MDLYIWLFVFLICDPGAQTSHKSQFFEIAMYASSERWINNIFHWCMVWTIFVNLESEGVKTSEYWENHLLKLFLAMHITNQ